MWALAEHCRRPVLERPVHSRACTDSRVSGEVGRAVEARAAKPPAICSPGRTAALGVVMKRLVR